MKRKVLLLGSTGKMGTALQYAFKGGYTLINKNSSDFNACEFPQVKRLIDENHPEIVLNTVSFVGIDACEREPEKAFCLNTLYPKFLAELSQKYSFLLVHFSTDAVFNDRKNGFYTENDCPVPFNIYGFTKYGGDCFIQNMAKTYYIFRTSILFGESARPIQFVEKMLLRIKNGEKLLRISDDIIASPTYSKDVAREIRRVIEAPYAFGLYHLINSGKASLYDLMKEIVCNLKLDVKLEKASFRDFPSVGRKNTYTPLKSGKLPSLRNWKNAVKDYCSQINSTEV